MFDLILIIFNAACAGFLGILYFTERRKYAALKQDYMDLLTRKGQQ